MVPLNCLLVPTSLVEVVEGTGYLGRVEPGVLLWQSAVKQQITSIDTLYHKEQPGEGGRGREGGWEGESREGEQKEGEFMFTVGHIFY